MKTTIIIPNYNGIEYLENCLCSLQMCEPNDFHIIVVDNGSTDGCVELLKEKFPTVEAIYTALSMRSCVKCLDISCLSSILLSSFFWF